MSSIDGHMAFISGRCDTPRTEATMSELTGAVPLLLVTWRRHGLAAVLFLAAFGLLGAPPADATVIETVVWSGHRYYLISENTGSGAELEAQALGGHLATINSEPEHNFLWNTWGGSLGTGLGLWIGLTDQASEGNFVWMSGEPVTFTNWASGTAEPNNGRGRYEEDFVNMDSRFSTSGKWNDVPDAGPGWSSARGLVELTHTPEPTTLVLFGSGVAAGLFLRRRRRRG
jgi:hypothetical protein